MGDTKDHIDTYCELGVKFRLEDLARRQENYDLPGHEHHGNMANDQSIYTMRYGITEIMKDPDNEWDDPNQGSGVDAQVYAGWTYDVMNHEIGVNGFDTEGGTMQSIVELDNPDWYNQAFYDHTEEVVYYGIPLEGYRSYAGCLDAVGHEWTHGLIDHTSGLDPAIQPYEPGALAESVCDMMGAYATYIEIPDHDQGRWWRIGENHFTDGSILRNMANPEELQHPGTYLGPYWYDGSNQDIWVHTNCGVPNKMFYLLAEGGTYNDIYVEGIEIENAMDIIAIANTDHYWDDSTNFDRARKGSVKVALDLGHSDWAIQVSAAWKAVNVRCPYIPGDSNNNGRVTGADITYLVAFINGSQTSEQHQECLRPNGILLQPAMDYNGSCSIDPADIIVGVNYFKGFGGEPQYCPEFPPFQYPRH